MKPKPIVTKEWLAQRLLQPDYAIVIGRALLAIYSNQTGMEQSHTSTITRNGIGFSKPDARVGSIGARMFKAGKLADWVVQVWLRPAKDGKPRICKYADQLNTIAEAKKRSVMHHTLEFLKERADIIEDFQTILKRWTTS